MTVLPSPPSECIELIGWMKTRGSSLDMNWGEDNDCWEVAWITNGIRFCGWDKQLVVALRTAVDAAREYAHGLASR